MLVVAIPAAVAGTNCYVVAPAAGERAIIVDPGVDVLPRVAEVVRNHRLLPAAAVLTHGHIDHVYSVTPLCDGLTISSVEPTSDVIGSSGVAGSGLAESPDVAQSRESLPAHIHADDRYRLSDPLGTVGAAMLAMVEGQLGIKATWQEPSDIRTLTGGTTLSVAGLDLECLHAPGHTEGSTMFRMSGVPDQIGADSGLTSTLLSGDVLFAGSIGRCDLPGGDEAAMQRSLREVVLPLPDDTLVLPGHGRATTIGVERAANPYLRTLATSTSSDTRHQEK